MSENLIRCYNNYLVTNLKTDLTIMTSYPLYGYNLKKNGKKLFKRHSWLLIGYIYRLKIKLKINDKLQAYLPSF